MTPFETLHAQVINAGLCTRCGTCVGVCPPQLITFADPLNDCLPQAVADINCENCDGPCLTACPGKTVDFSAMNTQVFGGQPPDYLVGHALKFFVGWAADPKIRETASSGGVMTALLNAMLERGDVNGVVCLIDNPQAPLQPRPIIATDLKTLLLAQQSKYSLAPVNQILHETASFDGPLAFVGLPHQVHAIRKLQHIGHPSVRNIKIIFGSYCGIEQHFSAVTAFLRKHNVTNLAQVRQVEYRAGKWPGNFRVTLDDGRCFEMEKFYANYMSLFYAVERSLLCVDLTNEFADLSFGDAWATRFENLNDGYSLIIARTPLAQRLLEDFEASDIVELEPATREEAIEMHSHGLYNKKVAVWGRFDLRRLIGRKVPDYGFTVERTAKQKIVGFLIAIVFAIGRTGLARAFLRVLPLKVIGPVFLFARRKWRHATKPNRHRNLQADFRIRPL